MLGGSVAGTLLLDGERLMPFGKYLRNTGLDELSDLLNVLRRDRSGIVGWAQVNGRNAISWEEKFALDSWYVDHLSFRLDMKILWLTVIKTIRREDISQQGQATMEEFFG